jgi:putative lipoprotein
MMRDRRSVLTRLSFLLACLAPLAPAGASAESGRVTGAVAWRERIALPPGYVVEVSLRDVSRQDAPAEEIASATVRPKRQPPIPFVLRYDRARIHPAHDYTVFARVLADGRLVFVSDRRYPVLTRGASSEANLLLRSVGARP